MPAPANDLCVNATVIAALPYSLLGIDISSATESVDDPLPGFIGTTGLVPGDTPFLKTTWYKWTCLATQTVQITTTNRMGIYVGVGSCGSFTEVLSWQPTATFTAVAGTTYYFMFGQITGSGTSFDLNVAVSTDYPNQFMITAQTASLPFSATLDPSKANDSGVVWFKYIPTAADLLLSAFPFQDLSHFPQVTAFQDPVNYNTPTTWPNATFTTTGTGKPIQVPGTAGQVIYFQFVFSTSSGTLSIESLSAVTSAVGDILVPDDSADFPATIIDGTTGAVKLAISPFAVGEAADRMPTGEICCSDIVSETAKVYNAGLTSMLGSIAAQMTYVPCGFVTVESIRTNQLDTFYIGIQGCTTTHATVKRLKKDGTTTLSTLGPFGAAGLTGAAPNVAETVLYYTGLGEASTAVHQWDIAGNTALADLAPLISGYKSRRPLLVLGDDTIVVPYFKSTATIDTLIKRYDSSGTVLNTYNFASNINADFQIARALDDPNSFWVWERQADGLSVFSNIKASDGSVLHTFSAVQFEAGINQAAVTATPDRFGHSESCPFVVLSNVIVPAGSGSIVVTKTTPGLTGVTTTFPFGATGGLSPSSFSLMSGASETFTGVAPGNGYGIFETPPAGWTVEYTVSNGSPINNITIGASESVTITAINTVANGPSVTFPVRRLRQSPHYSTEQIRQFFTMFQLDIEAGMGNPDAPDPQVMLSWSDDGGHTWSPERWVSAGKQGEYARRAIWWRCGTSRDRVWRIVVSDPVAWRILQAFTRATLGTN